MSKLRRSWIVMMVAIGLLASASVASADDTVVEDEAPVGDTLFSYGDDAEDIQYGYDDENHVFIVRTSSTDSTYDCEIPVGVMVGYGSVAEGSFSITALDDEGMAVEIPALPSDAGSEETGSDETCQFSGEVVAGPNGQINHGQFMKLFHQLVGKQASGCLNRIIAQSDLGKGEQQVRTSDLKDALGTDDSGADEASTSGKLVLEEFEAVCDPGKKDKGDHPSNTKGNKDKSQKDKSDSRRGNSGEAPGNSGNARGNKK